MAAKDDKYTNVTFLIALALIKSKIVEKWEDGRERFAAFEDAVHKSGVQHGHQLCQTDLVTDKIKEFVFPFSAQVPLPLLSGIFILKWGALNSTQHGQSQLEFCLVQFTCDIPLYHTRQALLGIQITIIHKFW